MQITVKAWSYGEIQLNTTQPLSWVELSFFDFHRLMGLVSNLNLTKISTVELGWLSWVSVVFVVGYNSDFGVSQD